MNNIMVDIETIGTTPGCIILSIGAVAFDQLKNEIGSSFYKVINRRSCQNLGLFPNPQTLVWWNEQSTEANSILKESLLVSQNTNSIHNVMLDFSNYVNMYNKTNSVKLWGNGADFDNAILSYTFHRLGIDVPWKFKNNRCFRTLKSLFPNVKIERHGLFHNALDDAITQALHAMKLLRMIK